MGCEHTECIPVRRVIAGGRTIVAMQCQKCGSGTKAQKLSDYPNISELPEFDPEISDRYCRALQREYDDRRMREIHEWETKTGEWWTKYSAYLNSNHWRKVRELVLRRDEVCQRCFLVPAKQAHHLSYTTFNRSGFSFPSECVGICSGCHDKITPKRV